MTIPLLRLVTHEKLLDSSLGNDSRLNATIASVCASLPLEELQVAVRKVGEKRALLFTSSQVNSGKRNAVQPSVVVASMATHGVQ